MPYRGKAYIESEAKRQEIPVFKSICQSQNFSHSLSLTHIHTLPISLFSWTDFLIYLFYGSIDYEFCKIAQVIFRTPNK